MAAEICTSEQLSRYLWMDFDSTKKMLEEDGCVVTDVYKRQTIYMSRADCSTGTRRSI